MVWRKNDKRYFAGFFKKAIPVLGGIIGGGLTFVTFKPCCVKLKDSLRETALSQPALKSEEDVIIDVIVKDIVNDEEISEDILEDILEKDDFDFSELAKDTE